MKLIKKKFKQSVLYRMLKRFKARKRLSEWTAHDQEMLNFYSNFMTQDSVCFDIGANIGNRVKIFLNLAANVIAVEPQSRCNKILRSTFGHNNRFHLIPKALGESEEQAEIMISETDTISSLSPEWIEAVKKSGRFSRYRWDKKQVVSITTLDKLVEQFGIPSFIKIDVEGYEYHVIKGLSKPVKFISLEFTPEMIETTLKCIDYLQELGPIRLNYTVGEKMSLELKEWVESHEMKEILSGFRNNNRLFGDVYVQFLDIPCHT